jgi:hypothetical protein
MKPKAGGSGLRGNRVHAKESWLLGLLVAALAIKIVVLVQLGNHPLLQPHGELDTAYYVELAQKSPTAARWQYQNLSSCRPCTCSFWHWSSS